MGNYFWQSIIESIRETFNFILLMDQRSLAVVTEGFELVLQDIRGFFAD